MRTAKEYIVQAETSEAERLRHRLDETESKWRPQLEPALERWRSAAAEIESLLASERAALESARDNLTTMQDRLEARLEEIATLTNLLPSREESPKSEANPEVQRKLDVSTRELAMLSRMLRTAEENARWLSDVNKTLLLTPFWWRFMSARRQQRKRAARLRRQGLFDAEAYIDRYPDVARSGIDPLRHYITHGQAEGRLR
jgi:ABC-type transporter Mla subunit MlaD